MTYLRQEQEMTQLPVELVMTPLMVEKEQILQSSLEIRQIILLPQQLMLSIKS